jgi:hypothetical protein
MSQPKREPIKWDGRAPYRGLGIREVAAPKLAITELPVQKGQG